MFVFLQRSRIALALSVVFIAGSAGILLYFYNPTEVEWIPRCPFLVLTGFKCPGCGTLRGLHHLVHGRLDAAWAMNPLMVTVLPIIVLFVLSHKISQNVILGRVILTMILLFWLFRNL